MGSKEIIRGRQRDGRHGLRAHRGPLPRPPGMDDGAGARRPRVTVTTPSHYVTCSRTTYSREGTVNTMTKHFGSRGTALMVAALLTTLVAAGAIPAGMAHAQAPAVGRQAPAPPGPRKAGGVTVVRATGTTAILVVASATDVSASALTPAVLKALGHQFKNNVGVGKAAHAVPLLVLRVGSVTTPNIKAALATIQAARPLRLYLLGMTHGQRLTIVTNILSTQVTIYINKTPGAMPNTTKLASALTHASRFVPAVVHDGTGARLTNAAQVAADTALQPQWPTGQTVPVSATIDTRYLPPVGNQGQESSCVGWSTSYYYKTFQEGKEHHWDVADPAHEFSPAFVYNQINKGQDVGSNFADAMSLLTQEGDASLKVFPYTSGNYTQWATPPQDVLTWSSSYRASDFGYFDLQRGNGTQPASDAALTNLKEWLALGDGFVIGMDVYPSFDTYTGGIYDRDVSQEQRTGGHAMMVVGYDDNAEGTGIGAFKLVNSWGTGWGEQGYVWLSYRFFASHVYEAWAMTDATGDSTPNVTTPTYPGPYDYPAVGKPAPAPLVYSTDQSTYVAAVDKNDPGLWDIHLHFVLVGTQGGVEISRTLQDGDVVQYTNTVASYGLTWTLSDKSTVAASITVQT